MPHDALPLLHPNAWRSSAWAILQGSPALQGGKKNALRLLFSIGWPAVYGHFRADLGLEREAAFERVQALFARLEEVAARREMGDLCYRQVLKRLIRSPLGRTHPNPLLHVRDEEIDAEEDLLALELGREYHEDRFDRAFARQIGRMAAADFEEELARLNLPAWREVYRWRQEQGELSGVSPDDAAIILYKVRQGLRRSWLRLIRATMPAVHLHDPGVVHQELKGLLQHALQMERFRVEYEAPTP